MKEQLKNIKDFELLHADPYFREKFVRRYINNLNLMAFELFGTELTYQQVEVLENVDFRGGRLVVPSGHGTGKTFLIGFISVAFILLFPKSIVRIQAPKLEQITKFSFKEISSCLNKLRRGYYVGDKLVKSEWSFLANFFQVNTTLIYIKHYKVLWYIEPATAPKGEPTNLSGQHNWAYLLIVDEASGVEDTHMSASLGALSETFNSCICFSQHTRNTGIFHESVEGADGKDSIWRCVRLNSELSPRVTKESLESWKATYTPDEYRVRVQGRKPSRDKGFLLSEGDIYDMFKSKTKREKKPHLIVSIDIAYIGIHNNNVCSFIKAYDVDGVVHREVYKHILLNEDDVIDDDRMKKNILPTRFVEFIFPQIIREIQNINPIGVHMIIDATAGGHEAYVKLEELASELQIDCTVKGLKWGVDRMSTQDKKRFINARAKAYVSLAESVNHGLFIVSENKYERRIVKELGKIPFKYSSSFKYQIISKEEMERMGIPSPDIADTYAQSFLIRDYALISDGHDDSGIEIEHNEDIDSLISEGLYQEGDDDQDDIETIRSLD